MKHLITRIAIASVVAALAATAAVAKADAAAAAPSASTVTVVNTMPSRILRLDWYDGQPAWRQATAARLLRSTFQFADGGRFALIQPGFAPVLGRFSVSGNIVRFNGSYRLSTPPTGLTTIALSGTLDLRTGRTEYVYEARQILVSNINGEELNQSKVVSYRASLLLRRV